MSTISIPCPECGQGLKIRDRSLLGRKAKCPKCHHAFVLEEPAEVELELAAPSPATAAWPAAPNAAGAAAMGVAVNPAVTPVAAIQPTSGVGRLREMRQRKSKGVWATRLILLLGMGLAGGGGYWLFSQQQAAQQLVAIPENNGPVRTNSQGVAVAVSDPSNAVFQSPTAGNNPLSLSMIPAGARTILHLRPSELWIPGSPGEEFRACLGPLGIFLDQQIEAICKTPPADIEELLFAWIPGQRGTPPDLALVVRLKEERKKSELLDIVGGTVDDSYGRPVYISGERAALILDLKTVAFGPADMASEMVNSVEGQNPMAPGIEGLLPQTDRQRHITIMFEPTAILLDAEFMVPPAALPFLTQCMDWFGDDAETICWSLHLESDRFFSDLQIRNTTSIRPVELEEKLRGRLQELPGELLSSVRLMQPTELGKRKIIGRVPAMAQVFQMASQTQHGPRHVQLITPLPDRAAPNLALGTLLAWDESTRTDFSRQPPPTSTQPKGLPQTIAERIKLKVDIDFKKTPLQEAFAYLSEEIQVTIDIDGDALKLSGYTQNMEQNMNLGVVPVTTAFSSILSKYDKMCLVVDEEKKMISVTTYPVAEQKGLKPLELPK